MKRVAPLALYAVLVLKASAGISIHQQSDQGWNVTAGTIGTSSYTAVSAQAGDVIVLTVAGNKKGAAIALSAAQVGGTGTTGAQTRRTNLMSTYPTSWAWYQAVTSTGTFDFDITTDNTAGITAITAMYVLRADSGMIQLEDSATWDDNDTADNGTAYSLSYTFGSSLASGVLIESISSRTDLITPPPAYTLDRTGASKRSLLSYVGITGSTWVSDYSLSGGTADKQTSGAVGMVFSEVSALPQPPAFITDPVVEADAVQGIAYAGTLSDNATDPNSDAMTFWSTNGPLWLSVAANGDLSGTPMAGDLGTNIWTVLVTDGISGTNSASLQIAVSPPAPPVASPLRTRRHPTGNYNVLFIPIDDMRPLINAYGETDPLRPITPQIDRLADAGVMFANAYCQQAVCNASRASLMTGLRPDTTMCWKLQTFFRDQVPDVITLPQHFGANGYTVHGIGKVYHSTNPTWQDDPLSWNAGWSSSSTGYTWYETAKAAAEDGGNKKVSATDAGEVDRNGDPITDAAYNDGYAAAQGVSKIATYAADYHATGTPFFLAVGFQKPHLPFNCPKAYWDLYDPAQIDLTGYTGIRQMPVGSNKFTAPYGGEPKGFDDVTGTSDNGMPTATEARHLIHGYLACVSFIDTQVGKLLDALEDPDGNPATDDSIVDSTIIVLWGDHGFHLGDHNGFWAKHSNYEIATRVPLIVSTPAMASLGSAGSRCGALVELVDLYPTLVDLCSLPTPNQPAGQALQGTTFLPLLEDPAQPWKKAVFSQYQRNIGSSDPGDVAVSSSGTGMGYSIRTQRYRYTEWWVTDSTDETDRHIIKAGITEPGHIELYDYVADPHETTNLASNVASNVAYTNLIAELSALLNDPDLVSAGDGWAEVDAAAPDAFPNRYTNWQAEYLYPGASLAELDEAGNPDGDTLGNMLEYKFGTHPFEADASPVSNLFGSASVGFVYPDVTNRTDISLEAQTSPNLTNDIWSATGVSQSDVGRRGSAILRSATLPVDASSGFLRLQAVAPAP